MMRAGILERGAKRRLPVSCKAARAGEGPARNARSFFLRSALAAVFAMTAAGARAQLAPGMTDGPIDITGDRLEVVDDVATWTGNVRAVQGEAILTAERLVADLDNEQSFTKIRALGTIRYSNGKEQIAGEQAVFDDVARTVTITGDVVVTQGEQVMTGGELIYWIDTGRILFTAPEGKRIRGVFHTKRSGESS